MKITSPGMSGMSKMYVSKAGYAHDDGPPDGEDADEDDDA